ncbi:hypothetical protein NESM_000140900 [Novymonas esmeraldas]|uniref:Uncharacterized protein n=1 Tax=Novymonas esmeraldas TaxID=1808958 RepID=A0AAW0F690_9TRYP
MNGSAPRLPRLGGHRSSPPRKTATTASPAPVSPAPSSRVGQAHIAHAVERADPTRIDVGYDDDGIPLASRRSSTLSRGTGSGSAAAAASSSSSRRSSAARTNSAAEGWRAQVKEEVLHGQLLRPGSPDAAAAIPREELYNALDDEEADTAALYAGVAGTPTRDGSAGGTTYPYQRFPVMVPANSNHVRGAVPPIPVTSAIAVPTSPVSVSSSIATDTPRSILRQPGAASDKTPRSGRRRISFVGVSPPRPDETRGGGGDDDSGEGDDDSGEGGSDEYESAEPSLRYDTEPTPGPTTATPPRHARTVRNRASPSPDGTRGSRESSEGGTRRAASPSPHPAQQRAAAATAVVASLSPERSGLAHHHGHRRAAVPTAPPPPEEEEDDVTLDLEAPLPPPPPQQQHRSRAAPPQTRDEVRHRAHSPSTAAAGNDDDVLTQPHNRSERGRGSAESAQVVRRPPPRQRWPSDAYLDDPPTETSETRRERLDPEDDMGSSSSSSYATPPRCETSLDKPHSEGLRRPVARSDPASPSPAPAAPARTEASLPLPPSPTVSPSGRLPLRRRSNSSASEGREHAHHNSRGSRSRSRSSSDGGGSVQRHSRAGSLSPPSLTQLGDTSEPMLSSSRTTAEPRGHHREHRRSPRRGAGAVGGGSPAESSSSLSPSPSRSGDTRECAERRRSSTREDTAPAPAPRDASHSPMPGQAPSTITDRSSGPSMMDDTSASLSAVAGSQSRRTTSPTRGQHNGVAQVRVRPPRRSDAVEDAPPVYVDALLRERRHRHERARQEAPPHLDRHAPEAPATDLERRHTRRRSSASSGTAAGQRLASLVPVSLRDVMTQHNSPAAAPSATSSPTLSSGGVPADDLVWDADTPVSRAGSLSSPPVSLRSSSATALRTPGGHKVLRKKLVVVVRRKKSGAAPSSDDAVMQLSLLPFNSGAAAATAAGAGPAPALEKLIDHVEPRRHSTATSSPRADAVPVAEDTTLGSDDVSEEGRQRFRRALSGLSSRSVSPRTSVSPSAVTMARQTRSTRTARSPQERSDGSTDSRPPAGPPRTPPPRGGGVTAAAAAAVQRRAAQGSSPGSDDATSLRRSDAAHSHHWSRRRHRHRSRASNAAAAAPAPSSSLAGAPYRATQNDEFYGAADMARDVAALLPPPSQERVGITAMSAHLLPRLVLRPQRHLHSNVDAGQRTDAAWSDQEEEDGGEAALLVSDRAGSEHPPHRLLLQQHSAATQTDRAAAGVAVVTGSTRAGMPLLAATPIHRVPLADTAAPATSSAAVAPQPRLGHDADTVVAAAAAEAPESFVKRGVTLSAADATPHPAYVPPLSITSLHMAAGAAPGAPYAAAAAAAVPLYVPPLTVDSVSHLSLEWQSTLRERSGKARNAALEQFLIASAEAGAAASATAAVSPPLCIAGPTADEPRQRTWPPAPAQHGLAADEFYGQPVDHHAVRTGVPLAAYALSPPRVESQSLAAARGDVRQPQSAAAPRTAPAPPQSGVLVEAAARHTAAAGQRRSHDRRASASLRRRASATGHPLTETFDVVATAASTAERGGHAVDAPHTAVTALTQPPAPLAVAAAHADEAQESKSRRRESPQRSRSRSRSDGGSKGDRRRRRHRSATRERAASCFSVVEPATEVCASPSAVQREAHHRKHRSRRSPSLPSATEPSRSHGARRGVSARADKVKQSKHHRHRHRSDSSGAGEEKGRRGGHAGRQHRSRHNVAHSRDVAVFDAIVHALDGDEEDSDVDSDLTTSMEFQLSRLRRRREAAAAAAALVTPAAASTPSRHTRREAKARRREVAARLTDGESHRSRSATEKTKAISSKAAETQRSGAARHGDAAHRRHGRHEKKRKEHRRATSPEKPPPLPPPPPPPAAPRSHTLRGAAAADVGDTDPTFVSAAPYSASASRYRRTAVADDDDDAPPHSRYASSPPQYSRHGSVYSGPAAEDTALDQARRRAAAHTGAASDATYERYRRRSHDASPLHDVGTYATSAFSTARWADTSRRAFPPAPSTAGDRATRTPMRFRSFSDAGRHRPSTRWHDYVREAERDGGTSTPSSPPHSRASPSVAQRWRSSGGSGSSSVAHDASPTYSAMRASPAWQPTQRLDDVDDFTPRWRYFNDDRGDPRTGGAGDAWYAASAATRLGRRRSRSPGAADHVQTARPSPHQGRSTARRPGQRGGEDDPLVFTPLHDGADARTPESDHDTRQTRPFTAHSTQRTRPPPPPPSPPPPPPPTSSWKAAVPEEGVYAALSRSDALPIVTEHTVVDAVAAERFAKDVEEVVAALQRYATSQ